VWKDPFTVPATITHQLFHDIVTVGWMVSGNTVV
jgi:hypothetical protein